MTVSRVKTCKPILRTCFSASAAEWTGSMDQRIHSVQFSHSVLSDCLQPHRRHPTRLPRPWDSPGKNTGVGCHFLLQCRKVKSESEVAQSYPILSDPMDCSLPGSSIHGIFQARVLEWGAIAFSTSQRRHTQIIRGSTQFSLVTQSWLALCDPMDCSTPSFPVHHQLPELAQTHVHRIDDAIQLSHPLSSLSPPAFNLSQHQGLF